jgi:hypothetical protein
MMTEKKKVLGKGKKFKDIAGIRKCELPRAKNFEDDYSKKFKSLKILQQDIQRKSNTPTPQTISKNQFFQRVSESPHVTTHSSFSKRKSLPNISEISEIYVKSLHSKLEKYKMKSSALEEEIKDLESKYLNQQNLLQSQIDCLNSELKQQKQKSEDQQIILQQEILKLRKENEESTHIFKTALSSLPLVLGEHLDVEGKDKLLSFINSLIEKDSNDCFMTGTFKHLSSLVSTSRENPTQSVVQAIVLTDYSAQSQGELNLKSGDIVTVLNSDEHNSWWLGRVGEQVGVFPRQHVMLD